MCGRRAWAASTEGRGCGRRAWRGAGAGDVRRRPHTNQSPQSPVSHKKLPWGRGGSWCEPTCGHTKGRRGMEGVVGQGGEVKAATLEEFGAAAVARLVGEAAPGAVEAAGAGPDAAECGPDGEGAVDKAVGGVGGLDEGPKTKRRWVVGVGRCKTKTKRMARRYDYNVKAQMVFKETRYARIMSSSNRAPQRDGKAPASPVPPSPPAPPVR
ncbi:hypothetical protein Taro_045550 [Colocasia esculenta]|uniref:Uncharacterized protein n=1 Tax=Colocasia esculenta TaxID=4460 RepID=A0A843X4Z9_COLES|nr:hypothetical protein [Colocasia esculenta]